MSSTLRTFNKKGFGLIGSLVSLLFSIIIGIVAIRFIFKLIGANASNGVVNWFYAASQPLVQPFFGIFGHDAAIGTARFELDTLIALIVYAIIAGIITSLLGRTYHRPHSV